MTATWKRGIVVVVFLGVLALIECIWYHSVMSLYGKITLLAHLMLWLTLLFSFLGITLLILRVFDFRSIISRVLRLGNPGIIDTASMLFIFSLLCGGAFSLAVRTGGTTLSQLESTLSSQHKEEVKLLEEIRDSSRDAEIVELLKKLHEAVEK